MRASRPATSTAGRSRLFAFISVCIGLTLGLGAGELWVRREKPRPPIQIVRGQNLHTIGDVPVWEWSTDREPRACAEAHPERLRILFLGSSITHGFSMPAEAAFTHALEERLNAARPNPGFCVMNFAQPGFTSQQKLAVGSVEIPRYRPALVLWEGWNEFGNFVVLGDGAYELRYYVRRADGFPGIIGVPDSINRFLFLNSRLYEYLTLRIGEQDETIDEQGPARNRLERLVKITDSVGARLAVYDCPRLDRPFREPPSPLSNGLMEDFVRVHKVPLYSLRRELIDQDYLKLRIDDCCHFSIEGHRVLVTVFERIVLELIDGKPAPR